MTQVFTENKKLIRCWTMIVDDSGYKYLVSVHGPSLDEAVLHLRGAGFKVVDTEEVRDTTILRGHRVFPGMEEIDWRSGESCEEES